MQLFSSNSLTTIGLVIIGIVFIFSIYYCIRIIRLGPSRINSDIYNLIPNIFTSVGVLFTFIGIFVGLYNFNVNSIDKSIPILLRGMKTAFLTSIIGLIFSIISNIYLKIFYKISSKKFNQNVNDDAKDILKNIHNELKQLVVSNQAITNSIKQVEIAIVGKDDSSVSSQVTLLRQENTDNFKVLKENLIGFRNDISNNTENLNKKFDEFGELLKKSNTEALVEVMKQVTEEINQQLSSLIDKLVQENFDQLNSAVANMIEWQQNNKEAMAKLTHELKSASSEISSVATYTSELAGSNSDLAKIVNELKTVILESGTFAEISDNLKNASNEILNSTEELHKWINSQSDFAEKYERLLSALEEVRSLEDLSHEFWRNTESNYDKVIEKLKEGVSETQVTLNNLTQGLDGIDAMFKDQLNQTLVSLDSLIVAMLDKYNEN